MAMGMVIIKQDLRVMYVFIQPPRKWNLDGFLDLIDWVAEISTKMVIPIQQMDGLPTLMDLLMLSRMKQASGMIQILMVSQTTKNS